MIENHYWIPFKVYSGSLIVEGPYRTRDDAIRARESMKRNSALNDYVGTPLLASSKADAMERAPCF